MRMERQVERYALPAAIIQDLPAANGWDLNLDGRRNTAGVHEHPSAGVILPTIDAGMRRKMPARGGSIRKYVAAYLDEQ